MEHSAEAPETTINRPFVLTHNVRGAMVVAALDHEACAAGLTKGMKLADARARMIELLAFPYQPELDADRLAQLGQDLVRYTPMVALRPPQALLLDMTGCLHHHISEDALIESIGSDLHDMGHSMRWAFANSADAALALAQHGLKQGAEYQLPIHALEMDERTHHALERAGLYTIGDIAERPAAPLAARFGAGLIWKLERLLGQADQPINPLRDPASIHVRQCFAEPINHIDNVLAVITDLFQKAALSLAQQHEGARHVTIYLDRCDGHVAQLIIETGVPTRNTALFMRLFAERIETLNDPLDPGFGYDQIHLKISRAEALPPQQNEMTEKDRKDGDFAALIAQLSIRLGRNNILRFTSADSHIPEHALAAQSILDTNPFVQQNWSASRSDDPPLRPLSLFNPPQRISVIAEVPDGPPRSFQWRRQRREIVRAEGPERIAAQWWHNHKGYQQGKASPTRDYYRVEDRSGHRYWLFRRGLYGSEQQNPDWYIHGLFA